MDPADPSLGEPLLRGNNPLLPSGVLRLPIGQLNRGASGDFEWARERLRVLSADSTPSWNASMPIWPNGRRTVSMMHSAMARPWR